MRQAALEPLAISKRGIVLLKKLIKHLVGEKYVRRWSRLCRRSGREVVRVVRRN